MRNTPASRACANRSTLWRTAVATAAATAAKAAGVKRSRKAAIAAATDSVTAATPAMLAVVRPAGRRRHRNGSAGRSRSTTRTREKP